MIKNLLKNRLNMMRKSEVAISISNITTIFSAESTGGRVIDISLHMIEFEELFWKTIQNTSL
jgi:hypothetical protein